MPASRPSTIPKRQFVLDSDGPDFGEIQMGFWVVDLVNTDAQFVADFSQPSVAPEPGALALAALGRAPSVSPAAASKHAEGD